MHNESKLLQALMFLPTIKGMPITRNAQKLHPVNPILMKRSIHIRGGEKDLQVVFEILRSYKLRLNASKCSFGVGSGKFLGYMGYSQGNRS